MQYAGMIFFVEAMRAGILVKIFLDKFSLFSILGSCFRDNREKILFCWGQNLLAVFLLRVPR